MEATCPPQTSVEGVSPRKQRKAPKKSKDTEESDASGENRQPVTEGGDLRSDSPQQGFPEEERGGIEMANSENRPTPSRPTSRSTIRSKHTSTNDPYKAKITNLVLRGFAGDAEDLLQVVEDCESCFPRTFGDELDCGCNHLPGNEALQEMIDKPDNTTITSDLKRTPNNVRDTVFAGAFLHSPEVLEACLKNGADLMMNDSNGRNLFHVLAATGDAPLLRKVLRRLEKTHGRVDDRRSPPKQLGTAQAPAPPDEESKLEKPSFATLVNQVDHRGWTPLLVAVARSNEDAVEGLLLYPQVTVDAQLAHMLRPSCGQEPCHSSAIHLAAIRCNPKIAKRVLNHGAKLENVDSMNRNLFHYAAASTDMNLAAVFFDVMSKESQFDPMLFMELDRHQRSPIFVALASGNIMLAEKMIDKVGSASVNSTNDEGKRAKLFSLTDCILKTDVWNLTSVHLAYLRRHSSVLFQVAKLWATYRTPEDPPTFVDALRTVTGVEMDPHITVSRAMAIIMSDERSLTKWIEVDLSPKERSLVLALKAGLGEGNKGSVPEMQMVRAVRRVGSEVCLRAYTKVLEGERMSNQGAHRGTKRMPLDATFCRVLKEVVCAENPPSEGQAILNFVFGDTKIMNEKPPVAPPVAAPKSQGPSTGRETRRGAERGPNNGGPGRSGSFVAGSKGGGFAAPLTGASPRISVNSAPKPTPERGTEKRPATHPPPPPRPTPPHTVNSSRMNRSTAGTGSPGFMSMTRSSANLFRNVTGPRPSSSGSGVGGKGLVPGKATPSIRSNNPQQAPKQSLRKGVTPAVAASAPTAGVVGGVPQMSFETNSESHSAH